MPRPAPRGSGLRARQTLPQPVVLGLQRGDLPAERWQGVHQPLDSRLRPAQLALKTGSLRGSGRRRRRGRADVSARGHGPTGTDAGGTPCSAGRRPACSTHAPTTMSIPTPRPAAAASVRWAAARSAGGPATQHVTTAATTTTATHGTSRTTPTRSCRRAASERFCGWLSLEVIVPVGPTGAELDSPNLTLIAPSDRRPLVRHRRAVR